MQLNKVTPPIRTHEGARAKRVNVEEQLIRSVLACLLWEKTFYESGEDIAERITRLSKECPLEFVSKLAIHARSNFNLRHVPLLLVESMTSRGGKIVGDTLAEVIQRPDELTEFLAIYWSKGKRPLSAQVKRGLAKAFGKFDEYRLAKYNRAKAIKLKDVIRLVHPKPKDEEQAALWKRLVNDELATPDTWEVALSGGPDKKATFERLLRDDKLGYMALLLNLRNMEQAGVDGDVVRHALLGGNTNRILPFRFIAATRHAPRFERELDQAMQRSMGEMARMSGRTVILVDHSGSMDVRLSAKSDLTRFSAACGLAILLEGICDDLRVFAFSNSVVEVPRRRGMALGDALMQSMPWGGTRLGGAIRAVEAEVPHDRIIVITDEHGNIKSHDRVGDPSVEQAYMLNVATYQNGVGYGKWTNVSGFSESVVRYIQNIENFERYY